MSAPSIGGIPKSAAEESLTGMLRTAEEATGWKGAHTTTGKTLSSKGWQLEPSSPQGRQRPQESGGQQSAQGLAQVRKRIA
jgi:hypothetical protein